MPSSAGAPARPVKAQAPELAQGASAYDAFKRITATLLGQMHANRQGVIEGRDPEYLHQMRVAVRRLRSLFSVYKKALPKTALQPRAAALKWLAHRLGPARDADVFAIEIWPPLREALGMTPLLRQLEAWWAARRRAAAAKARHALASRRYARIAPDLERALRADAMRAGASPRQHAALDASARRFARRVIGRRDARVRKHGRSLKSLNGVQLHALRIEIKKLRYAIDGFGSLFEKDAVHAMSGCLSNLQDVLGALNDLKVAERQVAAALAYTRRRGPAATRMRAAAADWRERCEAALRRKLRDAWRAYRHAERFW